MEWYRCKCGAIREDADEQTTCSECGRTGFWMADEEVE